MIAFIMLWNIHFAQKSFKGAELYSNQSYKYGKYEMRMKMAKGSGILSTFFTYKNGSETTGSFWEEIDIEVFGKNNAQLFQSNIISNNPKKYSEQVHNLDFSLADDYHTYTLEWTPEYVAWYIDDVLMRKTTGGQVNDLTNTQSLRFNLWAANITSWVGAFDSQVLPVYQFVNWIKYYSYTPNTNGSNFTLNWTDNFDTFNSSRWSKANWTFNENLVDFDPNNIVIKDGTLVLALTKAGQTGFTGVIPSDTTTDIQDLEYANVDIKIFPNPFNQSFKIETKNTINYVIKSSLGQTLESGICSKETEIGKDLTKGMYLVIVQSDEKSYYKKMIKE
ncbi:MAG: family 16 glycosylhydrolase [Cytophagales bacterium]